MSREKLKRRLAQELDSLTPITAWKNDDGSYELFGAYRLSRDSTDYRVTTERGLEVNFSQRRSAVTWCVADQCKDRELSGRVRQIDAELSRLSADLSLRSAIRGDLDFVQRVNTKLQHKLNRKKQLENDLDRCVRQAKRYQRGLVK